MPFVTVNLHEIDPPTEFDPRHVVNVLRDAYDDLLIVSNDALTERIVLAQSVLSTENEAEATVLKRMQRDQRVQGPAVSFTLTVDHASIQGVAKRQLLSFTFDQPLANDSINRLRSVIQSVHELGSELPIQVCNEPPAGPCRTKR